jgi:hypothetical protein
MAQQKGTHVTNFDATPLLTVNSRQHGGVVKYAGDTLELADTANNDTAVLIKLPIDAVIQSVKFACDDLGTAGTVDITFFYKNSDGTYTEIADGLIANGIDVNAAAVGLTEYRFSVLNINTVNQSAWELAGLSARPAYGDIYIGVTTDTGTTSAATIALQVLYTE